MSIASETRAPRTRSLKVRRLPLASASAQLDALARVPMQRGFEEKLASVGLSPLRAVGIDVLQVNVGKLCNQTCRHCHVDAGPDRTEVMDQKTLGHCLTAIQEHAIPTVDITGGAPELNPHFRWFVESCSALGSHTIDRCNLTILETNRHRDLAAFLAMHQVELICSLPHYESACTDTQRGDGVFEKSIRALQRLNALGYGHADSGLRLVLVTNPIGAVLPAPQAALEAEWRYELDRRYGVSFTELYTITNMPISRHLEWLQGSGQLDAYMATLVQTFNPEAARGVMCRSMVSVGWDGRLYDCDFNQMLELPLSSGAPQHIADFDRTAIENRHIVTDRHCFGCTAGTGSSCGGATTV